MTDSLNDSLLACIKEAKQIIRFEALGERLLLTFRHFIAEAEKIRQHDGAPAAYTAARKEMLEGWPDAEQSGEILINTLTYVYRQALESIREIWCNSECGEPVHAQEAYAINLCKQMYKEAVDALRDAPEQIEINLSDAITAFQRLPSELAALLNWGSPMSAEQYNALAAAWNTKQCRNNEIAKDWREMGARLGIASAQEQHNISENKLLSADEKENVWRDSSGDIWEPVRATVRESVVHCKYPSDCDFPDSITVEGRSKTDIIQDVYDEFVEHGLIIEATKLSAKDDKDFLIQCLRTARDQPPSVFNYEGAADYILGGLQNYNE